MNAGIVLTVSSFPSGIPSAADVLTQAATAQSAGCQAASTVLRGCSSPGSPRTAPSHRVSQSTPPNAEQATGRRNATYLAILRPDHDPFIHVIGARHE